MGVLYTRTHHRSAIMKLIVVVGVVLVVQVVKAQYEVDASEIAPYNVTREGDGYEVRDYEASNWVCTDAVSKVSPSAQRKAFFRLFGYITGNNEGEVEIPMTAPVTTMRTAASMEMCFYLPAAHQASPPAPARQDVYIQSRPPMTVYTHRFGGFANKESIWVNEAAKLKVVLEAAGE